MNKYNRSKIYKIYSTNTDLIFVGYCTHDLKKEFGKLKSRYKKHHDTPDSYFSSHELLKYSNCKIEIIESHDDYTTEDQLINRFKEVCDDLKSKNIELSNNNEQFGVDLQFIKTKRREYRPRQPKPYKKPNPDNEYYVEYQKKNLERLREYRRNYYMKKRIQKFDVLVEDVCKLIDE